MTPKWARNKRILLGVSGGIAAYKTCELVRALVKSSCEVEIILTDAAARLVSPLTLSTLSKRRVWRNADLLSDELGWRIPHISLTDWADVMIIAPCTANALRMAAAGDSSTLLGAAMLACGSPMVFFPAMNSRMWENPITKKNAKILEELGHRVVDPDSGPLACGYDGKGRLPSADVILDETWAALCPTRDFAGRKVLITAGPTHEYIDPVRFISNPSSGKMGYALAAEARCRGADVVLVSGPSGERVPSGVRLVSVTSAIEMMDACLEELPGADVIIKSAAVGDYRAKNRAEQKIKREKSEFMTMELERNPDIAREISIRKRPDQILVGFAAETENVRENALRKIESKGLDMIVANDVSEDGSGFAVATNSVMVFFSEARGAQRSQAFSGSKRDVAAEIFGEIAGLFTRTV
ncbi:MAG: bifunctional phosphopantothenoylcysteine decarboxylase/phosphopantothenate--cysteine ligase CoaBC [Synergistaceae bacterium]|jgi:phosphopantothenoylcysteine decarboxylase/phosphopantothenate--cysteine ligase|nr:bifunctional phosphopantothenoylcysteine decarboxylase/phosphopantothenate--cysteine ligase CoaBC [Synergistaceae bacterium]